MANNGSLKSTIAVSLTNYLDAGAIVAGASGLTLWQNYLGLSEVHLGWLNFISANCLGAAVGAIIGGFLADKYGRKFIFTYNLLVYMTGVLLVMLSVNFPMLLAGFLVTGISVGVGVPASWTYISESSENNNRGRNICISQMSWGIGPMVILLLGMLFAPGGYLFGWVEQVAQLFIGAGQPEHVVNVFSSRIVFLSLFIVAFIAWNLQRQLQESAEFTKGQSEGAEKKPGVIGADISDKGSTVPLRRVGFRRGEDRIAFLQPIGVSYPSCRQPICCDLLKSSIYQQIVRQCGAASNSKRKEQKKAPEQQVPAPFPLEVPSPVSQNIMPPG